ncbi:bacillithiol biosynthesis cysteine-adding enzyme BshC [Chishuiella changwenlii]|uniref:Putative cysteine ligase BshC n=1 Tax=Chishuiella changwenlii TaxID=1434701 RepID=A0A1M6ZCI0_9FLAO|nr:bacillithiol biosynthesis cysteine-adding enzyme BshC [Chishuiella changwenlii]GGE86472.1 putative cysteine ligase BshC [Chishuiella changwenlii]SHL28064.1 bacillithiol biosynthesis cysteine-adding enzyme BshC [Chishuiella changwenlii]
MEAISLKDSNYFSELMLNYINQEENLKEFYHLFPTKDNYITQAHNKLKNYHNREVFVQQIKQQLSGLELSKKQEKNLKKLGEKNTVTITTGHQLNLFTGPIFFFYKILQVIKACKELNKEQDEINYVPMFWMATEDHDFEEINHYKYSDRIIHWTKEFGGPVGRLSTEGLKDVFENFLMLIPNGNKKSKLEELINESYLTHDNLTDATRKLVHLLFKDHGLLMIDGDDKELKKLMIPTFEEELIQSKSYHNVIPQNEKLEKLGYSIQVNPREINLFYINEDNSRERIIEQDGTYFVNNTSIKFTQEEILKDLHQNPDKFSPNVILRPLYQETILPNIAYVGGGGEIAYWFQLKEMFNKFNVDFPLLVLRNSLLIRTKKQHDKQLKLNLSNQDLFSNSLKITKKRSIEDSEIAPELPKLEEELKAIFNRLENLSTLTSTSFANMIQAQRTKQLKGFEKIKKRLVHAEVKQNEDLLIRIEQLLKSLSQQNGLQERVKNFSDFDYVDLSNFIDFIEESLQPFEFEFVINTLNEEL